MKHWTRILPLFCLCALLCATLAAADFQDPAVRPTPLNCHQRAQLLFGSRDSAELLGADGDSTEAALSGYFAAREAAYRGDVRLLSADTLDMSASVAENNGLRTERVREMETRLGFTVLDADVTTRIERDRTVRNPDGTVTLYVYEWTFYDYDDLSDGVGGLDVSGFGTWHILTVAERPDGSCEILSDEYDESDLFGINTFSEEHIQEIMSHGEAEADFDGAPVDEPEEEAASLQAFSYYADYDVNKVYDYAETYWKNYNPSYASFNFSGGGDCANFASQCINAGGMPQVVTQPYSNNGWYYKTSTDRSATWTGSTNLRKWMGDNRGRLVTASKTTVYKGSPVFYSTKGDGSFQHTAICIGTNTAGTPIMASHNNDRWGVMWNYYTNSVVIDTVQLTSASFGTFSGYMNVGSDFHAYIINPSLSRYMTNDGDGTVTSRARTEQAAQVWHFVRLEDGSYQILSALQGTAQKTPALAAEDSGWASRTPICTENYAAEPGQQWYIYWDGSDFSWGKGAYQLRPKCSDRVMDIEEGSDEEGAALWLFSKNGSDAQLFQLYQTQWVVLDDPVLEYSLEVTENTNVQLFWQSVKNAGSYKLQITQGENTVLSVTVKGTSLSRKLDPGTYQASLEAISTSGRNSSFSAPVSFTVVTSYTITYRPNGGDTVPPFQLKMENTDVALTEELPTYTGYKFTTWNTQANGTGTDYAPGQLYTEDKDLILYARWEPAEYTVTLDPNRGTVTPDTVTVKYSETYGELPTPHREQFEFTGWFTEPEEGTLVTAETFVDTPEDHTLYAHWDSTIAYITSVVTKTGNYHMIRTAFYRIPNGSLLMACGYSGGQLVSVTSGKVGEEEALTLEGSFDTVRVMALDDTNYRPLCSANVIPQRQFR